MTAPPPPPPPAKGGGLSLYANLLDPSGDDSAATISGAPVRYGGDDASKAEAAAKKPLDSSLRFQPIRRPQAKPAKPSKPSFPKSIPSSAATAAATSAAPEVPSAGPQTSSVQQQQQKSTLADWAPTEADEWLYGTTEKRQRGGRRKKKNKRADEQLETDWDEIYDPTKPTNVDEYLHSDERIREVQDWKAVLYRHRRRRRRSSASLGSDDSEAERRPATNQFAPPANYNFAPPPQSPPPTTTTSAGPADDATGDDAYARRQAMAAAAAAPAAHAAQQQPPPPPPPSAPPAPADDSTISRAPVRYTRPEDDEDNDEGYSPPPALSLGASPNPIPDPSNVEDQDPNAPRSSRPGQAGFAQRFMSKYGWTKGSGLGADESGIINPLRVQVEKRKKKSDAEGGGWAEPANKARILGGKRKENAPASGSGRSFGPMSDVVVLRNMLEGMEDLQGEIADGLGQEIGEECGEKYGRVERLYIDVERRQVFIRFTDQVSALRAVNELDGRVFNGNTLIPSFYDTEKFEQGIYE